MTGGFNLWNEQWIGVIGLDGERATASLEEVLITADLWAAIETPSPLYEVGTLRLLIAIAQAALGPHTVAGWQALWSAERFDPEAILRFGARYADRFDLFNETQPFMQSGDLPLHPEREAVIKSVAYLDPALPSGSNTTLFRRASQWEHAFCPACCAGGLLTIPPFTTAGGNTLTKSINGIPPLYVFPVGRNLFETLAASLLLPDYWPTSAGDEDIPWWERPTPTLVERGRPVGPIGYLASLTFPTRRVRLYPAREGECTRCGDRDSSYKPLPTREVNAIRPRPRPGAGYRRYDVCVSRVRRQFGSRYVRDCWLTVPVAYRAQATEEE